MTDTILTGRKFWDWVDANQGLKSVRIDSHQVRCLDLGSGRPLLLLHGFMDTCYTWHRIAPDLVRHGFRVIAPDLPGFGQSMTPRDYNFNPGDTVRVLGGLMDHLGLERWLMGGNSLGGGLSLFTALEFPDRVAGLAVLDPACYPMRLVWSLWMLKSRVFGPLASMALSRASIRWTSRHLAFDKKAVDDDFINELAAVLARPDYRRNVRLVLRTVDRPEVHALADHYPALTAPTLIVWGRQDQLVPLELGRRLAGDLAGSRLVELDPCGHMPQLEHPRRVVEEMTAWFEPLVIDSGEIACLSSQE
jgi:pimeloyl-ACP methyl ester carboxylesterase